MITGGGSHSRTISQVPYTVYVILEERTDPAVRPALSADQSAQEQAAGRGYWGSACQIRHSAAGGYGGQGAVVHIEIGSSRAEALLFSIEWWMTI